jgi:thioredoxin-like negative regulator of GroEL
VSSLTFLVLCSAALGADNADSYADAQQKAMETGKPMVVMVSTEWCPPCQVMKKNVIPQVRQHGLLRRVLFAVVNPDRDRDLANQLTGGGPIPQLVMYRKTPNGWMRRKLIGGQSVESVEGFINEAVAQDEADAKAAGGKQPAESAKKAPAKDAAPPAAKKDQVAGQQPDKANDLPPVVPVSRSGGGQ